MAQLQWTTKDRDPDRPPTVDWDLVDEELARIPAEYKDTRFDSYKHVLGVLGAVDADAAVEELRDRRDRIEALVDDVVDAYHNGFNKAIHNYSQILNHFSECKSQVETVRKNLEDSKRRLGATSRNLTQQWKRNVTLETINSLLQTIDSIVDVPQRIKSLEDAQDWPAAVALLLDACNKLARDELKNVGALQGLKKDMSDRRNAILKAVVTEIEHRIYSGAIKERSTGSATGSDAAADLPGGFLSSSASFGAALEDQLASLDLNAAAAKGRTRSKSMVLGVRSKPTDGRRASNMLGTYSAAQAEAKRRQSAMPGAFWPSPAAKPALGALQEGGEEGGGPGGALPLAALVDCAVQVGGVFEVQMTLRRHMATQVRNLIIKAVQAAQNQALPADLANGDDASQRAALTVIAQKSLDRIFWHTLQVLRNLVSVLKLLTTARPPPSSAGLSLLITQRKEQGVRVGEQPLTREVMKREADAGWDVIQKECQRLLGELLNAPTLKSMRSGDRNLENGREEGTLTFSFEVEVEGANPNEVLLRERSILAIEAQDLGGQLRHALDGNAALPHRGAYLTSVVYQPTVRFVDAAVQVLEDVWEEGLALGTPEPQHIALREYLETFVQDEFLPDVYVDFRGRVTKMLEDPEMFRVRARLRSAYTADVAKGRPVLPVALQAEAMVTELLEWASRMPLFATHLAGVVENILGRVLDALGGNFIATLGTAATCRALAANVQLAKLMAQEPAAPQAGDPIAFFVGKPNDNVDAFVTDLINAGFGAGKDAVEADVLAKLLQERPIKAPQLLTASGDSARVKQLAALSDSLDYIGDAILRLSRQHAGSDASASQGGEVGAGSYTEGLAHLMDRYRSLAGQAVRALRLELLLLMLFHLQELPASGFVCGEDDTKEVEECIMAFSRSATRAEEELGPYLPPGKRAYVFGSLGAAAARMTMWLLPEIQAINVHGVARMNRMLHVLQPALSVLGSIPGAAFQPKSSQQFEKARSYYTLLTYSADNLIKVAAERPGRFTPAEWSALLQANVPDRYVSSEHKAQLQRITAPAAVTRGAVPKALATLRSMRGSPS